MYCEEPRDGHTHTRHLPGARTNRHGLLLTMDHAALVSSLATRETIDEAVIRHSIPKAAADLPTVPVSDLSTPNHICDAEEFRPTGARWHSMGQEFGGPLQDGDTFAPAPVWQSVTAAIDMKWVFTWKTGEHR